MHKIIDKIKQYTPLTWYLAVSVTKRELSSTYAGFLWWIVEPVFYCLLYYFVFAVVLEIRAENYAIFLLVGLIAWRWIRRTIATTSMSVFRGSPIIKQVDVPKIIFPIQMFLVQSIQFLFSLLVLVLILAPFGHMNFSTFYLLPVVLLAAFLFIGGFSLIISILVPLIPDLKHVVRLSFRVLPFISGVFFQTEHVPEKYRLYYTLNPLVHIFDGIRDTFFYGNMPSILSLLYVTTLGAVFCITGLAIHWKLNRVVPRYLS